MPGPIRCYSTNAAIGDKYAVYKAIQAHLEKNPPKQGEMTLMDHLRGLGVVKYPQIMRIVSTTSYVESHRYARDPLKYHIEN
jgi:DNA-directed RNA polymerase subunit N (RpoN/RPB10)